MAIYPTTGLQQDSTREGVKKALRSETELAYVFTRTQMLKKQLFSLHHILTTAQSATLEQFFYDNQGTIFTLNYDGVSYNCIFVSDSYAPKKLSLGYIEVTMNVREV